jgi:hypothetical protein
MELELEIGDAATRAPSLKSCVGETMTGVQLQANEEMA